MNCLCGRKAWQLIGFDKNMANGSVNNRSNTALNITNKIL